MAYIKVKDLNFTYPNESKKALKNINLEINRGDYITVCGRSGCGKTTLLKQLKPALTPQGKREGEVLFEGEPILKLEPLEAAEKIGYVMQDIDEQIVTDKVWHELSFGLENLGRQPNRMRASVAEMAAYFGLSELFDKEIHKLSGGQKQLLNLASVMAMHPEVLILDEPTAQLDPISASDLLGTIRRLNLELGITVIITEHRLEEIFPVSDKVIVMDEGEIIFDGSPHDAGRLLYETKNEFFEALPSPVRLFYSLNLPDTYPCPLTVREGRALLNRLACKNKLNLSLNAADEKPEVKKETAIELKSVWLRYEKKGEDILKGINLRIDRGLIYALVGANGSGKSTLLKAISKILKPYKGRIYVNGELSMLPQDPKALFVKQSIREELEEMLESSLALKYEREVELKGSENVPLHPDALRAAKLCRLENLLTRHPYDVSVGEQERAALAKVLMTRPDILLIDEPTKGMDAAFKKHFAHILKDLKNMGVTILMVSHDIEFCAEYADRAGLIFDGEITAEDSPGAFFAENFFYTTSMAKMMRGIDVR